MKVLVPNCPQPQLIPEGIQIRCKICNTLLLTGKSEGGWPATDLLPEIAWRILCPCCKQPIVVFKSDPNTTQPTP